MEACGDIDFCRPSDEKRDFALTLLGVLEKNIKRIPDDIFWDRGFRREEILFFAAMSDGDYIQEMTDASVKMFNAPETLEIYEISQQ